MSSLPYNKHFIRLARQSRGMSQKSLAEHANLSQGMVSKLENGIADSNAEALNKIAGALGYPVDLFYSTKRAIGLPFSVHAFRKKASTPKKQIELLESEINFLILHLEKLLESVELEPQLPLPYYDSDDYSPEEIAKMIRTSWQLPRGPIDNLIELIEQSGCLIYLFDGAGNAVDGISIKSLNLPPIILLNRNSPGDRQRFTLAHELGHIIMHRYPTDTMEDEANRFAAELLMPEFDIRPDLNGRVSLKKISFLKVKWKCSMASIIMTASRVKSITSGQKTGLFVQMSRNGYRKQEPVELDFPAEKPHIIDDLIEAFIDDLNYTEEELAEILYLKIGELTRKFNLPKNKKYGGLKIIK